MFRFDHTCHTLHAWHSGWGETSLPWGRRLLMVQGLLLMKMACLVMLLVEASLLMLLRQARLGGWEVWLRREGRGLNSSCHQISNHSRRNWGHSWHHRHDGRVLY